MPERDQRQEWLDEAITYRQYLTEQTMLDTEVEWYLAQEAVASVLLGHPEVDGDQLKSRREWTRG
jgi:hypothetical protein